MKCFLLSIIILFSFCCVDQSIHPEEKKFTPLNKYKPKKLFNNSISQITGVFCVNGVVIVRSYEGGLVQLWETNKDGNPRPMKCE